MCRSLDLIYRQCHLRDISDNKKCPVNMFTESLITQSGKCFVACNLHVISLVVKQNSKFPDKQAVWRLTISKCELCTNILILYQFVPMKGTLFFYENIHIRLNYCKTTNLPICSENSESRKNSIDNSQKISVVSHA